MRILFSSLGSPGHTYPLIPLAIAARGLGHEVLFATSAAFGPVLAPHGIEHVAAGMEVRQAFTIAHAEADADLDRAQEVPPQLIVRVFGDILPRAFAREVGAIIADRRPDLVVHEIGNVGAGLAAQVAGVPALCHGFGHVQVGGENPVARAVVPMRRVAEELGAEVPADHPLLLGNPHIDICPASVQHPTVVARPNRVELQPVPFAATGELPAWVTAHHEPLVYLTLGTAFGDVPVLRTAIEGLGALGARVLVATGPTVEPEELGDVPDHVAVLPWVPQADLLPHVDLVVHHGGSGTTLGAFGAGVPQLVVPQGADQFDNAAMVVQAGLGNRLIGEEVTAEAITTTARHLLTDEAVRAAAKVMAAEVAAMPSPREVAGTLPRYA